MDAETPIEQPRFIEPGTPEELEAREGRYLSTSRFVRLDMLTNSRTEGLFSRAVPIPMADV